MRGQTLKLAGYVFFAVSTLVVFMYLGFPAQALAQRAAFELQKMTQGSVGVTFGEVSPYRLSGVAAEHVTVTVQRKNAEPVVVELDELRARVRLLPLLLARVAVSAEADVGKGSLSVAATKKKDGVALELDLDELDLAAPPILPKLAGVPFGAKVSGGGDLFIADNLAASTGTLDLELGEASFGPGQVSGFTMPATGFGTSKLELTVKDGRVAFTEFSQSGGNVGLELGGDLTLRGSLASSTLDLCLHLRVTDDAFLKKNDKLRTALQFAEVRFQKDAQGFLNIPIRGPVSSMGTGRGLCNKPAKK